MPDARIPLTGDWSYPTRVRFGAGRIRELAEACTSAGMTRPLLVTDPRLAGLPMVEKALAANARAGLPTGLFSDVKPNPVGANVDAGLEAYRAGGHDGVVALGGGSSLDAGKAIALMSGQKRPIWDFEDKGDNWTRADADGIAPVVAVPTTAGTGSETGRSAVITNQETRTKVILFHPAMMPSQVISDAELTVGLPPGVTAATGMDALSHCLEAFAAPFYHPMAEGIALEGMRLIKEWLPVAFADGANLTARAHMLAAASMGSTAFQRGLGAIHALSHPVSALYDTHHGLANAVFMPYVMVFNRDAIAPRMDRLARFLGLAEPSFDGVLDWILDLRRELGIPHTADGIGVEESRLDELAGMAARDPLAALNPVKAGVAEMRRLYAAALAGAVGG